jgi:hypothetical protein
MSEVLIKEERWLLLFSVTIKRKELEYIRRASSEDEN